MAAAPDVRGRSVPEFPFRHDCPAIVCGSAAGLLLEFEEAQSFFPEYFVVGANAANHMVPTNHGFSLHPPHWETKYWLTKRREKYPDLDFAVHGYGSPFPAKFKAMQEEYPFVEYWWFDVQSCGTSGWGAVKLAKQLGATQVVLCGMPLDARPYVGGDLARGFQREELVEHYRQGVKGDTEFHDGVCSMSGWTREFFGGPEKL